MAWFCSAASIRFAAAFRDLLVRSAFLTSFRSHKLRCADSGQRQSEFGNGGSVQAACTPHVHPRNPNRYDNACFDRLSFNLIPIHVSPKRKP